MPTLAWACNTSDKHRLHRPESTPRKTIKPYDIADQARFLTFSCFRRQPLLNRDRSRHWCLPALDLGRTQGMDARWAFVIMPAHVHRLLWPQPGVLVRQILPTLKQSVSKRALVWVRANAPELLDRLADIRPDGRTVHRFGQRGGGYDRNLWSPAELREKIRYLHANPVRRGLVPCVADWPWSSWRAGETGLDEPIAINRESVPDIEV